MDALYDRLLFRLVVRPVSDAALGELLRVTRAGVEPRADAADSEAEGDRREGARKNHLRRQDPRHKDKKVYIPPLTKTKVKDLDPSNVTTGP